MHPGKLVGGDSASSKSLSRIVDTSEDHVTDKGKNRGIGMHGSDSAECEVR